MPECVYDYAAYIQEGGAVEQKSTNSSPAFIFIACGQSDQREIALGLTVQTLLRKQKIDSFLAETVNDLESLNSLIFKNLNECAGFIAILHKRAKGDCRSTTSTWINQEVAITAFLRWMNRKIPSLVLYEEGADIEGLIKYTIANPPVFKKEDDALKIIRAWIVRQDFEHSRILPEIEVILKEDRRPFGARTGGGDNDYHDVKYSLSFRIRNKSDINVCLENVSAENNELGVGVVDRVNKKLSQLPFNIGPRRTEELNLLIEFPGSITEAKKGNEFNIYVGFEFADMIVQKEVMGFISQKG